MRTVLDRVPDALVAVEVIGRGYRANRHFPEGEINGELWLETVDELVREPVTRVIIRDPAVVGGGLRRTRRRARAARHELLRRATPPGSTSPPRACRRRRRWPDVASELGVDQADVLAIGDGRNDVEMLAWAGRGVAMGQAPDAVKDVADAVTASWEDDGAAVELARWFDLVVAGRTRSERVATARSAPTIMPDRCHDQPVSVGC